MLLENVNSRFYNFRLIIVDYIFRIFKKIINKISSFYKYNKLFAQYIICHKI